MGVTWGYVWFRFRDWGLGFAAIGDIFGGPITRSMLFGGSMLGFPYLGNLPDTAVLTFQTPARCL